MTRVANQTVGSCSAERPRGFASAPWGARRDIGLLGAMSRHANFSEGCFHEEEWSCHRSILRKLLDQAGAKFRWPAIDTT